MLYMVTYSIYMVYYIYGIWYYDIFLHLLVLVPGMGAG
jgi:hypothetical protein